MKVLLLLLVLIMTVPGISHTEDWKHYNSSLLIEVTRPKGVFTCTGVAVSKDLIVTAAHCLEGNVVNVRVFLQDHYDAKLPSLPIKGYKLHPQYNPSTSRFKADLAKIDLKNPLPDDIEIHPIYRGTRISGKILRFGFGGRNNQNIRTVTNPNLRNVNLKDEVIELNDEFSKSGDSGGPIFMDNGKNISILAIHSTFSFGPEGNYSLNPILGNYIDWVFEN